MGSCNGEPHIYSPLRVLINILKIAAAQGLDV